jgi:hypothetical protein
VSIYIIRIGAARSQASGGGGNGGTGDRERGAEADIAKVYACSSQVLHTHMCV